MTAIELRQKLIDQISRLSLQKLFFLEKLIQNSEKYFPESSFEYSQSQSQSQSLDLPLLEDDPIIGMCSGKIPKHKIIVPQS